MTETLGFLCCKTERKNILDKFEENYRSALDIRKVFIKMKKIKFIEKLLFSESRIGLEEFALHKKICEKAIDGKKLKNDKDFENFLAAQMKIKFVERDEEGTNNRI